MSEPVVSGDGRRVAFALDDERSSALVSVDVGTRRATTLRRSTTTDYYGPSYSPDSRYLAWAQETASGSDLAVATADGAAASVVQHRAPGEGVYVDAAWSPRGDRIAASLLHSTVAPEVASLVTVAVRGGAVEVLAPGGGSAGRTWSWFDPSWSSDGATVHASRVEQDGGEPTGELHAFAPSGLSERLPVAGYAGAPSFGGARPGGDGVAPGAVSAATATVRGTTARLTFSLPADADLADVVVTRSATPTATTSPAVVHARTRGTVVDLALPAPGTAYAVELRARDWSDEHGAPVTLTVRSPAAGVLSVSAPAARLTFRAPVRVTGRLLAGGRPVAGQPVVLYARRAFTATPLPVARALTSSTGTYVLATTPAATAEYQVRSAGSAQAWPAASAKRVVAVAPAVALRLSTGRAPLGRAVTLSGSVAPAYPGGTVSVQRQVAGGAWRAVGVVRLSATSTYRYLLRPDSRGTWALRVVRAVDRDNLPGISSRRTLSVR